MHNLPLSQQHFACFLLFGKRFIPPSEGYVLQSQTSPPLPAIFYLALLLAFIVIIFVTLYQSEKGHDCTARIPRKSTIFETLKHKTVERERGDTANSSTGNASTSYNGMTKEMGGQTDVVPQAESTKPEPILTKSKPVSAIAAGKRRADSDFFQTFPELDFEERQKSQSQSCRSPTANKTISTLADELSRMSSDSFDKSRASSIASKTNISNLADEISRVASASLTKSRASTIGFAPSPPKRSTNLSISIPSPPAASASSFNIRRPSQGTPTHSPRSRQGSHGILDRTAYFGGSPRSTPSTPPSGVSPRTGGVDDDEESYDDYMPQTPSSGRKPLPSQSPTSASTSPFHPTTPPHRTSSLPSSPSKLETPWQRRLKRDAAEYNEGIDNLPPHREIPRSVPSPSLMRQHSVPGTTPSRTYPRRNSNFVGVKSRLGSLSSVPEDEDENVGEEEQIVSAKTAPATPRMGSYRALTLEEMKGRLRRGSVIDRVPGDVFGRRARTGFVSPFAEIPKGQDKGDHEVEAKTAPVTPIRGSSRRMTLGERRRLERRDSLVESVPGDVFRTGRAGSVSPAGITAHSQEEEEEKGAKTAPITPQRGNVRRMTLGEVQGLGSLLESFPADIFRRGSLSTGESSKGQAEEEKHEESKGEDDEKEVD